MRLLSSSAILRLPEHCRFYASRWSPTPLSQSGIRKHTWLPKGKGKKGGKGRIENVLYKLVFFKRTSKVPWTAMTFESFRGGYTSAIKCPPSLTASQTISWSIRKEDHICYLRYICLCRKVNPVLPPRLNLSICIWVGCKVDGVPILYEDPFPPPPFTPHTGQSQPPRRISPWYIP